MKRSIVLILMAAIVGMFSISAIAAEGVQERWDGQNQAQNPYYNDERMSLEGTVELTASGVELKTNDGSGYELMYPRFLAEDVQVRDGQTVAVEGFLVPGPRWDWGVNENHLRVDKVTIDGKEYDITSSYGQGYGPRGGAWAPGTCWGYGSSGYGPQDGSYGPGARGPQAGGYSGRGPGMMGRW